MSKKIIELKNVSKIYDKNKYVLDKICFDLYEGEIVGLIGENGSGKSTLMKLISGLIPSSSGEIIKKFNNEDHGFLIEEPAFFPEVSGANNIKYYQLQKQINDGEYINDLVERIGLTEKFDDQYYSYSLGMKKKLALVLALINKPKVLILDEPYSGLDFISMDEMTKLLLRLQSQKNISILISSHQLNEIYSVCNRFIFIYKGRIVGSLSKEEWVTEKKCIFKYVFPETINLNNVLKNIETPNVQIYMDNQNNTIRIVGSPMNNDLLAKYSPVIEEVNLNDYYQILKERYE